MSQASIFTLNSGHISFRDKMIFRLDIHWINFPAQRVRAASPNGLAPQHFVQHALAGWVRSTRWGQKRRSCAIVSEGDWGSARPRGAKSSKTTQGARCEASKVVPKGIHFDIVRRRSARMRCQPLPPFGGD